jgi:hypothetical protein
MPQGQELTMANNSESANPMGTQTKTVSNLRVMSNLCFVMGFLSIVVSIIVWAIAKEPNLAHGERFGIFIGLWAPTFFILSDRLDRYARTTP